MREEDGVLVEKRKAILEGLAMHWESLGKVTQLGADVPIDNLKSKAKEVNWMMEPVDVVPGNVYYCEGVEEGKGSWS